MTSGDSVKTTQPTYQLGNGGLIPTSPLHFAVREIPPMITHEWLLKKHYAKRLAPISWAFGLYDDKQILQGVVTYGTPLASQLQGICSDYKVVELNRLVVNDNLPKNTLSFFVSKSLRLLPPPLVIVSYSDTSMGHHGYIYQATNFIYTGLGAGGWGWAVRGLEHLHHTSIEDSVGRFEHRQSDVRLETLLRYKYGDKLFKRRQPAKHRYITFVADKKTKLDMRSKLKYQVLPYPKGDNTRYEANFTPTPQGLLI